MNELDNLTTVGINSRRGGGQDFDVYHDPESNKIIVSDALYAALELNTNGFTAHVGNGNVYLSVQPNADSVSYRGREGYDKGKEFKSTTISELFTKAGLNERLSLQEIGQKDGVTFYRVQPWTAESMSDELVEETQDEPQSEGVI